LAPFVSLMGTSSKLYDTEFEIKGGYVEELYGAKGTFAEFYSG